MKHILILLLLFFGGSLQAESLRLYEITVQLSMVDRPDMVRTFVVQDKQKARFNMAPEGERKVFVELVPDSKGRKKITAVDMKYHVEVEDEKGNLNKVQDSLMIANSRRPASMSVEAKGMPTFSIKMEVKEKRIHPTVDPSKN